MADQEVAKLCSTFIGLPPIPDDRGAQERAGLDIFAPRSADSSEWPSFGSAPRSAPDCGPVLRQGDRPTSLGGSLQPGFLGDQNLVEGLVGCR
jgi:hypothetical protein